MKKHRTALAGGSLHGFARERFVSSALNQADGHPDDPMPKHHSVLTGALIDAPGEPTHTALQQVLGLFRKRLLGAAE